MPLPIDPFDSELFKSTTTRNEEGRYIVAVPFKDTNTLLSTRYFAEKSLHRLELNRNLITLEQYHTFMD